MPGDGEGMMGEHGMPMQCQHCQDAPCITVCPTGALHRDADDGPVLLTESSREMTLA